MVDVTRRNLQPAATADLKEQLVRQCELQRELQSQEWLMLATQPPLLDGLPVICLLVEMDGTARILPPDPGQIVLGGVAIVCMHDMRGARAGRDAMCGSRRSQL